MYFSYRQDITRSFQSQLQHIRGPGGVRADLQADRVDEGASWKYIDKRFVFNRGLLEPFMRGEN